jgi:hypothetical protein
MRWETQKKTLEKPRQGICHASEARFYSENRRVAVEAQRDRSCAVMWRQKVGDARKEGFVVDHLMEQRDRSCAVMWLKKVGDARNEGLVVDHLMEPDTLLVQTGFRGCRNEVG